MFGRMEIPLCFYCKHRVKGRLKCAAFNESLIPMEILSGKFQHIEKHKKQSNEVVFEPNALFMAHEVDTNLISKQHF